MMTLPPPQRDLAYVVLATDPMCMPCTMEPRARGGVGVTLGSRPSQTALPVLTGRGVRAHANAVEHLVLSAPLVLFAKTVSAASAMPPDATRVHVLARLIHCFAYVAGIPLGRTLALLVDWDASGAVGASPLS